LGGGVTITEMNFHCLDSSMAIGTDTGLSRPEQGLSIPEG